MQIFGVDFTSAPKPAQPMACASCRIAGGALNVDYLVSFDSLEMFQNFLGSEGPWIAAIDFPFGQPGDLVRGLGWKPSWPDYVAATAALSLQAFERCLAERGDEADRRETDQRAGLCRVDPPTDSPRSYFRGAPCLLRSPVSILPCRPARDNRVVVEGHPALVARRLLEPSMRTREASRDHHTGRAREAVVGALLEQRLRADYSVTVKLDDAMAQVLAADAGGGYLDALLCAVQAAWAWTRRDQDFGIPDDVDPQEGWIVDPALRAGSRAAPES